MTALPPVKNYLPARGRAFGSEKIRAGAGGVPRGDEFSGARASKGLTDAVGFQNGAEAMLAGYHGNTEAECWCCWIIRRLSCGATFAPSGAGLAGRGKTRGSDGGTQGFPAVGGVLQRLPRNIRGQCGMG